MCYSPLKTGVLVDVAVVVPLVVVGMLTETPADGMVVKTGAVVSAGVSKTFSAKIPSLLKKKYGTTIIAMRAVTTIIKSFDIPFV